MNWKTIALGSTLAGTLMLTGLSGQALACWGAAPRQAAAAPADRVKLDEIRQKYDVDLITLEARLRTTSLDLDQALADRDSAKADDLRQKLDELEREYYGVRDRAWDEMAAAGAIGARGRAGRNCRWHEGHDGAPRGAAMGNSWTGGRGGCLVVRHQERSGKPADGLLGPLPSLGIPNHPATEPGSQVAEESP